MADASTEPEGLDTKLSALDQKLADDLLVISEEYRRFAFRVTLMMVALVSFVIGLTLYLGNDVLNSAWVVPLSLALLVLMGLSLYFGYLLGIKGRLKGLGVDSKRSGSDQESSA